MTNDCASGKLRRLGLLVGAGALALGASHGVFAQNAPQRASQATGTTPPVIIAPHQPPAQAERMRKTRRMRQPRRAAPLRAAPQWKKIWHRCANRMNG